MRFASRRLVLVAAIALPLAVAVGSFAFTDDVSPPDVPARVQVGESLDPSEVVDPSTTSRPPSTPREQPTRTPSRKPHATAEVVPPPPVQGGDDDDDDGDDDDD